MLITRRLRRRTAPLNPPEITLTVTEDELLALATYLDSHMPVEGAWWRATPTPLRSIYEALTRAADDVINGDRAGRRDRSL